MPGKTVQLPSLQVQDYNQCFNILEGTGTGGYSDNKIIIKKYFQRSSKNGLQIKCLINKQKNNDKVPF